MKVYKTTIETMVLAGRSISYTLICSDRQSLSVEIGERGILVKIPRYTSRQETERFLRSRAHWILAHYDAMLERQEKIHEQLQDEKISDSQKEALEKRYRHLAREVFEQRASYYSGRLGVKYSAIRIAEQKTRWGSCSSSGTLSFNWRLIMAPSSVLDYVVVHEVSHLIHMNHSEEFWKTVSSLMPDYKVRRKWLKDNGALLAKTYKPLP